MSNSKKSSQTGFGALGAFAVIIVVTLLGASGWFVWQRSKTNNVTTSTAGSTSPKATAPSQPESTLKPSNRTGWNTYVNSKLGITMEVPQQVLDGNGGPCEKVSYKLDNYGNKVPATPNYIASNATVPVTVVTDGSKVTVAPSYTYQPTGSKQLADGSYSLNTGCQKVTTDTAALAKTDSRKITEAYVIDNLPITVTTVSDQAAVKAWFQKQSSGTSVTDVTYGKPDAYGGQEVSWTCQNVEKCYSAGGRSDVRYYAKQHRLVDIYLGQAGHLQKPKGADAYPNGEGFYSIEIAGTVRAL